MSPRKVTARWRKQSLEKSDDLATVTKPADGLEPQLHFGNLLARSWRRQQGLMSELTDESLPLRKLQSFKG